MEDKKKKNLAYRMICRLVWFITPKFKISGTENIPDEPCIIVGNHSHMYGPITAELYTPGDHYVWCAGEMMDLKEVHHYAYEDFWSGKPIYTRWFYKLLSYIITPLSVFIFSNAHTIPVYHDMRVIRTFRQSMDRLKEGNNIVIFPETYEEHNNIVNEFQDRFVDLAKMYYKRTGKVLSFVPQYLAPKLRTIYYGEPVSFDPSAPIEEEREKICAVLMDEITEIATSLPKHTVIPYPNVSKKRYPTNIPLEVHPA